MARSALLGSTAFAHLVGVFRTADGQPDPAAAAGAAANPGETAPVLTVVAAEDDDDDKQKPGESDDDYKARKAKKKSKAAEDDDDDTDDKDEAHADRGPARRRERARCAAIFASPHAARRPDMAAYLAFGTSLSRTTALNTLAAVAMGERTPAPAQPAAQPAQPAGANEPDNLRSRMAREPVYEIGEDGEKKPTTGPKAFAAAVIHADKMRRGLA